MMLVHLISSFLIVKYAEGRSVLHLECYFIWFYLHPWFWWCREAIECHPRSGKFMNQYKVSC